MSSTTSLFNEPKTRVYDDTRQCENPSKEEVVSNISVNYCVLINAVVTGKLSTVVSLKNQTKKMYPRCLALAITHAKWNVFDYLLKHAEYIPQEASVAAVRAYSTTAIRALVKAGYDINSNNNICISLAVANNDICMVKALIALGASLDIWGVSLLETAVGLGLTTMVHLLVENNAPGSLPDMLEVSKLAKDHAMEKMITSLINKPITKEVPICI